MTGACRPTPPPPQCLIDAVNFWYTNAPETATIVSVVWDALLAEGEIYNGADACYVRRGESVLVVPLVADKDKDNKEDYEGGVNWP